MVCMAGWFILHQFEAALLGHGRRHRDRRETIPVGHEDNLYTALNKQFNPHRSAAENLGLLMGRQSGSGDRGAMMPPIEHCSKGIVAMQGWSRGGWLFSRASRWFLVVLTVVGVLAASSCTFLGNVDAREALIRDGGTTIDFHGIVVSLPDGVAPVGTKVSVRREAQKGTSAEAVAVSDGVVIELEGGLQPAEPLTLVFPVSQNEVPDADDMPELLVVRSTSGDGQVDLHAGTYDEKAGTYTVDVDHLSGFQVFGIDLGAVLQEVRTGVMQGLGLEFPAPDCVGEAVTIDEVTYRVESPPQSWICLEAKADALVVKAYPNSAIPFVVGSWPSAEVRTSPTEVQLATSTLVVLAKHLGFTDSTQAAVMPGTMAELRFSSAPEAVTVTFEQYPALLLVAILITTVDTILDVLGVQTFIRDVPAALQCFADAADVADRGVALNGESAGGITRAFFDCAGPMLGDALSASIRRSAFVGDGFGILGRLPDSGVGGGCGLSAGVPGLSTAGSWSCP